MNVIYVIAAVNIHSLTTRSSVTSHHLSKQKSHALGMCLSAVSSSARESHPCLHLIVEFLKKARKGNEELELRKEKILLGL